MLDLQSKATTDVSRSQAQLAIDNAKKIISEARQIVVGTELSQDSDFKMQLINGLLETVKIEYHEVVSDGIIEEMAEFQDGSAFVWCSQQIYDEIGDEFDPIDSARIDDYFDQVWKKFDQRADPQEVENWIDAVIYEFEELSGIPSEPSAHEEEVFASLSPLKQLKVGVEPQDITCKDSHELIFKPSGNPACVKPSSVSKLVYAGWIQ